MAPSPGRSLFCCCPQEAQTAKDPMQSVFGAPLPLIPGVALGIRGLGSPLKLFSQP